MRRKECHRGLVTNHIRRDDLAGEDRASCSWLRNEEALKKKTIAIAVVFFVELRVIARTRSSVPTRLRGEHRAHSHPSQGLSAGSFQRRCVKPHWLFRWLNRLPDLTCC